MANAPVFVPPGCGNKLLPPSDAGLYQAPVHPQARLVPYAEVDKYRAPDTSQSHLSHIPSPLCPASHMPWCLIPVLADAASLHTTPKLLPISPALLCLALDSVCEHAYVRACKRDIPVSSIYILVALCRTLEVVSPVLHSNCKRTVVLVIYSYYCAFQTKASSPRAFLHLVLRLKLGNKDINWKPLAMKLTHRVIGNKSCIMVENKPAILPSIYIICPLR